MKTLFISLVIAILVSAASSAALTAGNLLVLRKLGDSSAYSRAYVDEITTSGTVVQTFDANCYLKDLYSGALSFNEDYTSAAFVCYQSNAAPDPKIVVAIQANGTMDMTTFSSALAGFEIYCAFVDGRGVWVGTDSASILYARRNGDVIFPYVVSTSGTATMDIQMKNGAFYIGGFTDTPYFVASVEGGAPKTISNAINFVQGSDIIQTGGAAPWNRFWVFSSTEVYGTDDSGRLSKLTLSGSQWQTYRVLSANGALGLAAQTVGSKRVVYITTRLGDVVSYEDDGTQFLNKVVIKTYVSPTQVQDVIYINAAKGACGDGSKNLDETDVDCGGYSCGLCANTKGCQISDDCASGNCNPLLKCSVPSCQDTFQNQDETDADCGGAACTKRCADTKKCFMNSDCNSNYCNPAKKCSVPSCSDGFQNQGETDVDCGGPNCPACVDGKACSNPIYCQSQYCNPQGKCSIASCNDGFVNQNETDTDCGGFSCIGCGPDQTCRSDSDCITKWCRSSDNTCQGPSCADNVKNFPETDVDCGGSCSKCTNGKSCSIATDCLSANCTDNICAGSLCADNVMDGMETDVDCGGGECDPCADGKSCKKNNDCVSNDCDTVKARCRAPTTPSTTTPDGASPSTTPDANPASPGTSPIGSLSPGSGSPVTGSTPVSKPVSDSIKLGGAGYIIAAMLFVAQWMFKNSGKIILYSYPKL